MGGERHYGMITECAALVQRLPVASCGEGATASTGGCGPMDGAEIWQAAQFLMRQYGDPELVAARRVDAG